jgi:catechol-2,3-dioxygenase
MVFEHFAINAENIQEVVSWYVTDVGLEIVKGKKEPPFLTFLADSSGKVIMELYHRPDEVTTDFVNKHPLAFHVAFVSENTEKIKEITKRGCFFCRGSRERRREPLVMLRDPWGMPLQLCQRTNKF